MTRRVNLKPRGAAFNLHRVVFDKPADRHTAMTTRGTYQGHAAAPMRPGALDHLNHKSHGTRC